ncbi:MAG: hypothetical protein ACRC57_00230 [Sarcina sp.]
MKKILCSILAIIGMSFAGCTSGEIVDFSESIKAREVRSLEIKSLDTEFETFDMNFGKTEYVSSSDKVMPYEKKMTISVPKIEGKKKLAIILHGSYDNENEDIRFDSGFDYLTEELAKNGYIGASLDVQSAYVWKYGDNDDNEKIRAMYKEFIQTLKNDEFLGNEIDFSNVILIGHSRAGETIQDIAMQDKDIKGFISIAPVGISRQERVDLNGLIIVPEYDGDVVGLDGIAMYDQMIEDNKRESDLDLIILQKANHNYFNKNIKKNDVTMLGDSQKIEMQLSKEEQQEFLKYITVDFMNHTFGNLNENSYFNKDTQEVKRVNGFEVKTKSYRKDEEYLVDENNFSEAVSENVQIKTIKESSFYKLDETRGFNIPMFYKNNEPVVKRLLSMEWKNKGDKMSIPLDNRNLLKHKVININIAQDPSNELNIKGENQGFTIVLKDSRGREYGVIVDTSANALDYVDGKLDETTIFEDKHYFWSSYTPLTMVRIPLDNFDNIDLADIVAIEFIFDQTNSGAIMLENIKIS